jgi:hypothetical protein
MKFEDILEHYLKTASKKFKVKQIEAMEDFAKWLDLEIEKDEK